MLRTFADGQLFGETYGEMPPSVVALHGWARTHDDFGRVLPGLDAVAFDLPGFGATPPPPAAWGSADYAKVVAAAITEPAILLGHSLGGRVAVCLAAARPDLVRGLVLTGVPLLREAGTHRPALRFRVARALNRRGLLSEARMEQNRQRYGAADYRAATGVMRAVNVTLVNESYEAELAAIRCRVEMVWGDDDTAAPLPMAQRAAAMIANASLQVITGAGHMTPETAPDELRAAIARLSA